MPQPRLLTCVTCARIFSHAWFFLYESQQQTPVKSLLHAAGRNNLLIFLPYFLGHCPSAHLFLLPLLTIAYLSCSPSQVYYLDGSCWQFSVAMLIYWQDCSSPLKHNDSHFQAGFYPICLTMLRDQLRHPQEFWFPKNPFCFLQKTFWFRSLGFRRILFGFRIIF